MRHARKKLSLTTETLRRLQAYQLEAVAGGALPEPTHTCNCIPSTLDPKKCTGDPPASDPSACAGC